VGLNLVLSDVLDGNVDITMPGSISVPNYGSSENKENTGSQKGARQQQKKLKLCLH
jgi:hypothetical protein